MKIQFILHNNLEIPTLLRPWTMMTKKLFLIHTLVWSCATRLLFCLSFNMGDHISLFLDQSLVVSYSLSLVSHLSITASRGLPCWTIYWLITLLIVLKINFRGFRGTFWRLGFILWVGTKWSFVARIVGLKSKRRKNWTVVRKWMTAIWRVASGGFKWTKP